MNKFFESILIPVDLSDNTQLAVKKGLELAGDKTVIHLLYVQTNHLPFVARSFKEQFVNSTTTLDREEIVRRLEQWKASIEETLPVEVCTWLVPAKSIQPAIEKKAKHLSVDLIIIGKKSNHAWLPFLNTVVPSRLVQKTGIPVLTVKPGSMHNKVRKVVVPVSTKSVNDKMEIIAALAKKFKMRVYLVTIMDNHHEPIGFYASSLLQFYSWIKTSIGCPAEYAVLKGRNKAKAILNYAEKINADILLLNPESETKIGWMNTQISDVLPPTTKFEILTVQPVHSLTI